MRKLFAVACLFAILPPLGCSSAPGSVKQLDESNAARMVADYLGSKHFQITIDAIFPPLEGRTRDDYRTGIRGPVIKALIEHGLITQTANTLMYPEVSGTFLRVWSLNGNTVNDAWTLHVVPGTNQVEGECTESKFGNHWASPAKGTIEPDGKVILSCQLLASAVPVSVQYYEEGAKGFLTFKSTIETATYNGPATGKKVGVLWYSYDLAPDFKAQIKSAANHRVVDGGDFKVGTVTRLRLEGDTSANANFSWTVTLNSTGKLFYPENAPNGTGRVVFGQKPDKTWALDSVTGVGGLTQ